MERDKGQGRPDQPKFQGSNRPKEQGGPHKEEATNASFSPVKAEKGSAVFNCVVPEIRPRSLFEIRRWLLDENLTQEQAQKLERDWLASLKTMDRKNLEETLKESKEKWDDWNEARKRKELTAFGRALLPALKEGF